MASIFFVDVYEKPHTVVSSPSVSLCEVNYKPWGKRGTLSKHNARKRFTFRSNPAFVTKEFVCERDCYLSFLFSVKNKKQKQRRDKTFM